MVKTPTLKNKFNALLNMVDEAVEDLNDNFLGNKFFDATQLIEEETYSIENSPTTKVENNHKFLHDSWANLVESEGNEVEMIDGDSIPHSELGFTIMREKRNMLKNRSRYRTR